MVAWADWKRRIPSASCRVTSALTPLSSPASASRSAPARVADAAAQDLRPPGAQPVLAGAATIRAHGLDLPLQQLGHGIRARPAGGVEIPPRACQRPRQRHQPSSPGRR